MWELFSVNTVNKSYWSIRSNLSSYVDLQINFKLLEILLKIDKYYQYQCLLKSYEFIFIYSSFNYPKYDEKVPKMEVVNHSILKNEI